MGKASKWVRALLALKRPDSPAATAPKEKRRWSFVKSYREKDHSAVDHHAPPTNGGHSSVHVESADPNLPPLTAVTVTVVGGVTLEESAAVKIQAAFRGSLARKALRALKGLVKLQALVRGEIERKRTSEWLQRVQTLLRIQAQAQFRAGRAQILHSPYWNANSSTAHLHGSPHKSESPIRSESIKYDRSPSFLKRNSSKPRMQMNVNKEKSWWSRACSLDEERCVRILENDYGKAHMTSKGRSHGLVGEVQCYSPLKWNEVEENSSCGADNSPRTLSSSSKNGVSKRSPFTPTKSEGSKSHVSGCSEPDYPSYMAYTESSMAKVRSASAPKQRPLQYQRSSSSSHSYSLHDHGFQFGDSKLATQRSHANFTNKAYPGSGRLDKLGLPVPYYK